MSFPLKFVFLFFFFMNFTRGVFASNDTIINTGSVWKYLDNGTNQGTLWRSLTFNDASWRTGPSQLGYGDGDEATIISYGGNASNKYITTYFRKTISIPSITVYSSINLLIKRDDGIIVYVNGIERYRNNMPTGSVNNKTKALADAADDGGTWTSVILPPSALINGTNVIAAEIHQSSKTSPDISFDMILYGDNTCGIPSGLSSSQITSSSAFLSWSAVSGAASYDVQYRIVGSGIWSTPVNTITTGLTLSGLSATSSYEWQVRTNCSTGSQSVYSSVATFITTSPPPCNSPYSIAITSITTSSANISWNSISGATNYTVEYRLVGATTWTSFQSSTSSLTLSGLQSGKCYEIHIATNCASGTSSFSYSESFTTLLSASILARSVYIQMVGPTSFRLRWRTTVATNSLIRFGTTMSYDGGTITDANSSTEHDILVSGLLPNTKYYYTVGSTTQDLLGDATFYTYTAISYGDSAPFRVWATGDFGNSSSGQTATRDAMNRFCSGNLPRLWIWMGDNAYNSGTDAEYTNYVFNIYPKQMKNIPIYPCLGNHDYANVGYQSATALGTGFPYFSMFTCPSAGESGGIASGTEKYYSYNYGNVHFIVLDSYGSLNAPGSTMYNWLSNDLAANTQRFTVVMWHHPPYSHGTHDSDSEIEMVNMRTNIVPLLETYKVDLVLNGHSHTYERSWLIKGHYGVSSTFTSSMKVDSTDGLSPYYMKASSTNYDGTVYCVCGVSGQGGVVSTLGTWPYSAMESYSNTQFGSMIIDFNGDTLDAKFLTSTGSIYDRFKIVKTGTGFKSTGQIITGTEVNKIEIFPNPFEQNLNVRFELSEASSVKVEIHDLLGKKIWSNNYSNAVFESGLHEINISEHDLSEGSGPLIIQVFAGEKVLLGRAERIK